MNLNFAGKKGYVTLFVIAVLIILYLLYSYVSSFQTVTFRFDRSVGSVKLTGDSIQEKVLVDQEPVRLQKGEYVLTKSGQNISSDSQRITVDGSTRDLQVTFNFTYAYLQQLLASDKDKIESTLLTSYPKIDQLYTITAGQLYRRGEWYGAALVAKNSQADNSDTLHVVMKKTGDNWQILSTPPRPVLIRQEFTDVPYEILRAINQAR